jgi:putative transposase
VARKPRFTLPGIPQHVIQRGHNRAPCFFADEDYRFYRDSLKEVSTRYSCQIHAYVLMTNHVYLLLSPEAVASPAAKGAGEDRITGTIGKRQTAAYTF